MKILWNSLNEWTKGENEWFSRLIFKWMKVLIFHLCMLNGEQIESTCRVFFELCTCVSMKAFLQCHHRSLSCSLSKLLVLSYFNATHHKFIYKSFSKFEHYYFDIIYHFKKKKKYFPFNFVLFITTSYVHKEIYEWISPFQLFVLLIAKRSAIFISLFFLSTLFSFILFSVGNTKIIFRE